MSNENFVVVGGSHGIGLGLTQRLIESGASVTVVSRTDDQLVGLPGVTHLALDVLSENLSAEQLPSTINGFAYCPGSINLGPIRGVKPEALVEDFRLNVVGAVTTLQAALPGMKQAGHSAVVLFSTVAVAQGMKMHSSVAASKGAVEGLSRTLASELAPNIRVNCIAPALTDTPLAARLLSTEQKRAAMAEMYPLKRVGNVDDIAALAQFLLSDASSWITGQVIGADGGMSRLHG